MGIKNILFTISLISSLISYSQELYIPGFLKANSNRVSPLVKLNWLEPGIGNWLQYGDSANNNSFGYGNFDVGIKLDISQLNAFKGMRVSKIAFIPSDESTEYRIGVWKLIGNYSTTLSVQTVIDLNYNEWNEIELIDEVYVDAETDLIFGYSCFNAVGNSTSYSVGNATEKYSDLVNFGGGFFSASKYNLNLRWNIKVYLEPVDTVYKEKPAGYNVYRNEKVIDTVFNNFFYDSLTHLGKYNYQVSAIYGEQESLKSENVTVLYDTNWVSQNNIVVEEFTSIECSLCPGAARGIKQMVDSGLSVAPIAYHTYNFGIDQFANDDAAEREKYYRSEISGFPTTILNGNKVVSSGSSAGSIYNLLRPIYDSLIKYQTPIAMSGSIAENFNGGYKLLVQAEKRGFYDLDNYKIHTSLTETNIEYDWLSMSELEYVHRASLPNNSGNVLDFSVDSVEKVVMNFNIPEYAEIDNYELVSYIQNNEHKEILNSIYLKMNEIEYRKHTFTIHKNGEPIALALIKVGLKEAYTDIVGQAVIDEAYDLDSITFSIWELDELLYEGKFSATDENINVNLGQTGFENKKGYEDINIYPNPVSDKFTISNATQARVDIYNLAGSLLKTIKVESQNQNINVSDLTNGTYLIKINSSKGIVYRKFIRNK